jgi:hypothetical protein
MGRYNPLGDNSNSLCEYCGSGEPGVRCTIKAFINLLFILKDIVQPKKDRGQKGYQSIRLDFVHNRR